MIRSLVLHPRELKRLRECGNMLVRADLEEIMNLSHFSMFACGVAFISAVENADAGYTEQSIVLLLLSLANLACAILVTNGRRA